jgi:hypothetical protein
VIVDGEGGGTWTVTREHARWHLDGSAAQHAPAVEQRPAPLAEVTIPAGLAWRLFTKGLAAPDVTRQCPTRGDRDIAAAVLSARAIVG